MAPRLEMPYCVNEKDVFKSSLFLGMTMMIKAAFMTVEKWPIALLTGRNNHSNALSVILLLNSNQRH